jgi:hypothetical protein
MAMTLHLLAAANGGSARMLTALAPLLLALVAFDTDCGHHSLHQHARRREHPESSACSRRWSQHRRSPSPGSYGMFYLRAGRLIDAVHPPAGPRSLLRSERV